jgi:hypothetical protein
MGIGKFTKLRRRTIDDDAGAKAFRHGTKPVI